MFIFMFFLLHIIWIFGIIRILIIFLKVFVEKKVIWQLKPINQIPAVPRYRLCILRFPPQKHIFNFSQSKSLRKGKGYWNILNMTSNCFIFLIYFGWIWNIENVFGCFADIAYSFVQLSPPAKTQFMKCAFPLKLVLGPIFFLSKHFYERNFVCLIMIKRDII